MTANALYKALGKLIDKGHGRMPVCVRKDTFQSNLEADGLVFIHVCGVRVSLVTQMDGDGFIVTNSDGTERLKTTVVIFGDCNDGND